YAVKVRSVVLPIIGSGIIFAVVGIIGSQAIKKNKNKAAVDCAELQHDEPMSIYLGNIVEEFSMYELPTLE
ncbi:MAG: hypothetical protein KDD52_09105, partial [Bdellovibrionales bacterium]|nr:hypothetical protein [Bdellovibrionales bacterium]